MSDWEIAVALGVVGLILTWGAGLIWLAVMVVRFVRDERRERQRAGALPADAYIAASAPRLSDRERSPRAGTERGSSHSARSRRKARPR